MIFKHSNFNLHTKIKQNKMVISKETGYMHLTYLLEMQMKDSIINNVTKQKSFNYMLTGCSRLPNIEDN